MTAPAADNPQGSATHDPWEMIGESEAPTTAEAPRGTGFQPVQEIAPSAIPDPSPSNASDAKTSGLDDEDDELGSAPNFAQAAVAHTPGSERSDDPDSPHSVNEQSEDEESEDQNTQVPVAASSGGWWTIPVLSAGLCLIACCVLIPQADANRRLAYEKRVLEMDLASIKQQVALNDAFLKSVGDDPTLAERLAQRQMKIIRAGTRVLPMKDSPGANDMSPFQLVRVAPPAPLPPYRPVGGVIARLCYNAHTRLYLTGAGLLLVAVGLVLGSVRW